MTPTVRAEAAQAALLAGGVFVAATPALGAYRVAGAGIVVAASAALSVTAATLSVRWLRLGPLGSYGLSLVGLLALLLCADGPHAETVLRGLTHGPNRILTETLPLIGDRASVTALTVLVWLCGAAAAELALRQQRPDRRPLALAVPVLLYVACFAAASAAPRQGRNGASALLVCLAALAALWRHAAHPLTVEAGAGMDDPGPSRKFGLPSAFAGRNHSALTGVAAAAVLATAFALLIPASPWLLRHPATLRRRPPTIVPVVTDPVDSMAQLRDGQPTKPAAPVLTVTLSAPSTGYLAVGYLDSYDGGQWGFSAGFQPTGGRIPEAPDAESLVAPTPVAQQIRVTGALPLALLPAIDRPSQVTGLEVVVDPATGMFLPQSPRAHPSYSVVSAAPDATVMALSPADALGPPADAADLAIPAGTAVYLATTVRFVSSLVGAHPAGNLTFLRIALQGLQTTEKRVDPTITPLHSGPGAGDVTTTTVAAGSGGAGTSLSEVINAVTVDRAATPEQFATFFAVLARYLGVPARVVTGFRLSDGNATGPLPAGTYRVTNRQAWAWVEIPVEGFGWVICDPTPGATTAVGTPPPESVSAPATTVPPLQANAVPRSPGTGGHALAPPGRIRITASKSTNPWLLGALGLGSAVLAVAAAGPGQAGLRRSVRRRRRRDPDPTRLAVGAWLELLDGLEQAGMRLPAGATSSEVAEEVGHHFGADLVPDIADVAVIADQAIFSTRPHLTAESGMQAWTASQRVRRKVLAGLDGRHRVRSSCMVGSAPSRPDEAGR